MPVNSTHAMNVKRFKRQRRWKRYKRKAGKYLEMFMYLLLVVALYTVGMLNLIGFAMLLNYLY